MIDKHRPLTRAQQFLLVASCIDVCLGWTYAAQNTASRAKLLDFLPFSPQVVGLVVLALGFLALIATFRHRGLRETVAWAAVSSGPLLLTLTWIFAALIHTPWDESMHVALTLGIFAATAVVAVRWARYRTGRLIATVAAGTIGAGWVTWHSQVSTWSAWSSATIYGGFWVLIFLGALSTTPTGWGHDD